MAKKNQSLLGLPKVTPDFGFSATGSLVPLSADSGADLQPFQDTLDQQLVVQDAYLIKGQRAMDGMSELHLQAGELYRGVLEETTKSSQQARNTDHQPYYDEFVHQLRTVSAQQLLGCVRVAGTSIAKVVVTSPFPPRKEKKPQRTWFSRLLLGDVE